MEDQRLCTICTLGFENESEMIKPCQCKFVQYHKECLAKWIDEKKIEKDTCEICKTKYIISAQKDKSSFKNLPSMQ